MENRTMMQYFEWYLPENGLHWKRCREQAKNLKEDGIDILWLPPAYKGAAGKKSVGYDVYDTYDLGEFHQKNTIETKYGTKEEYLCAIRELQNQGIEVLADIVLNHMMGADDTEELLAQECDSSNREKAIQAEKKVKVWTKFKFTGRNDKYSSLKWNASMFSGTDWNEEKKKNAIFRFHGKQWDRETDSENVNYDYLMGADLDMNNPDTVKAVTEWGKWYLETAGMDGFRLDAVKHIKFEFYPKWLQEMRTYKNRELFAVGEYWSPDVAKLLHYLDVTEHTMCLFDVPLHFSFLHAATSNGQFDLRKLFDNTLLNARPDDTVTFVDNHDTQPGQALESYIPAWFKPLAYAIILLRKEGLPCVFYGDYYGIPHDRIAAVPELKRLLRLRKYYAYGEQRDYFDDATLVGFTRGGDMMHPGSGLAVLMTDGGSGSKRMYVGTQFAGGLFYDALGHFTEPIQIDKDGTGEFRTDGGAVSVWCTSEAYEDIWIHMRG